MMTGTLTAPAAPFCPAISREGSLLASWGDDVRSLDWDFLLRYQEVAELLDRLLRGACRPVRVLEVGCNNHNLLPRLLDPERASVSRCDVQPFAADPDFFAIPPAPPWPIADETYDAVVALEVLEHMPAARRPAFIAECLRVARHGAIFTCPNGVPEVAAAEAVAAASYQRRHGHPHPFLQEHLEHGLPAEEDIRDILRDLDVPHAVRDNAPLDVWLPMLLLSENLKERQTRAEVQRFVNAHASELPPSDNSICYRKIYVCAKTFDATAALEPAPTPDAVAPDNPSPTVLPLHHFAAVAGAAFRDLAEEYLPAREEERRQLMAYRHRLAEYQDETAALLEDHRDDLQVLQGQLAASDARREDYRYQVLVLDSFVRSLLSSKVWALLAPVRAVRNWLRPRGFDASALIPWRQLEPALDGEVGSWIATGPQPSFVVPCAFPAGWLRIRLTLVSDTPGPVALYADHGAGDIDCLERTLLEDRMDREFLVRLRRPALALRFDPRNAPGAFRVERLEAKPLSPLAAFLSGRERPTPAPARIAEPIRYEHISKPLLNRDGRRRLNIVYVLRTAGLCGGVKVVLEHVTRLRERGHDAILYHLDGDTRWFPRRVPARSFASPDALRQALADFRGIKVATWHETAPWVADSLRAGDRGYYLVQDIEESYCDTSEAATAVLDTYRLGLKPLTEGTWVRDQLRQRFGLESAFVSIGLDHDIFQPQPTIRDPQRILTQMRTWSGGGDAGTRLKGWQTARDAVLRCLELNPRTALTTFSMEERVALPPELLHVHMRLPSDEKLAHLYRRAGLYLLTSTHEGFGLTAAEAMACGCPVVATRAQGNEEFCIDGRTALLADAGDIEALAAHCHRLQTDPDLADELARNARQLIQNYTWDRVIDRLEQEFLPGDDAMPSAAVDGAEYPNLGLDAEPSCDWTFVIPTVNEVRLVVQSVATCRQYARPGASLQFIVVDDGTQDPTVLERLESASRDLGFELLRNHQNLGFSATINNGLRHARGRFIVLCNNDVEFFQPWDEPLAQAFDDPAIGIVGGKLLYPDGTIQHAGMAKVPNELTWVHAFGKERGDHVSANESRDVWAVTGALFALRRATLCQLGGLSTAYATAYEDVDYCLHARQNGVRVVYRADVAAYHLEGGTRGATPGQKRGRPLLWAERERAGRQYFEQKWAALRAVEDFAALRPTPHLVSDAS